MKAFDYLNRDFLIKNIKERLRHINKGIKNDLHWYKVYSDIANSDENLKETFQKEAKVMSDAIDDLRAEKVLLIEELKDRFEYDYIEKNKLERR